MFAEAMSQLSGQFLVAGTSLDRDVCEKVLAARVAVLLALAGVLALSGIHYRHGHGLLLRALLGPLPIGLYPGMDGFAVAFFLLIFLYITVFKPLDIYRSMFGVNTPLACYSSGSLDFNKQFLDNNIVAMPIVFLIAWAVSKGTAKFSDKHLSLRWH